MKVRIDIDTRTFVRFWLVVIGFALAALIIYSARTALFIIGAALFLAVALSPAVNRLSKILPSKSRVLGTAISYFVIVLALGAVIFLVIPPIINQTAKFAENVPNLIDSASKQYSGVNSFINTYHLQPEFDKIILSIKTSVVQFASGIGSVLVTGIGSVFSTLAAGVLVLALGFLMLVEGPSWMEKLWSVYKDRIQMQSHRRILKRMTMVVNGYVTGQLSVSAIAGVIAGILVFVLSIFFNVPANLSVPAIAIMFVLSLIPMFGEMIAMLLISLMISLNSFTAALIFLVFFVIYTQIEGNVISPRIQSKRIDLSALIIIISVTIGIYLFGIIGGIISIPIAGCIRVISEEYFSRIRKVKGSESPSDISVKILEGK